MKSIATLMFLFSFLAMKAQELITISGKTQIVSYPQGGVQLPPVMMEPRPLPNTSLYVVQYFGPNENQLW